MPPAGAIGDTGEKQRLIKTLTRKGFRFVGAVQEQGGLAIAQVDLLERNDDTAQRAGFHRLGFPLWCCRSRTWAAIPSKTISWMG